jgi:hypothetical protein
MIAGIHLYSTLFADFFADSSVNFFRNPVQERLTANTQKKLVRHFNDGCSTASQTFCYVPAIKLMRDLTPLISHIRRNLNMSIRCKTLNIIASASHLLSTPYQTFQFHGNR